MSQVIVVNNSLKITGSISKYSPKPEHTPPKIPLKLSLKTLFIWFQFRENVIKTHLSR